MEETFKKLLIEKKDTEKKIHNTLQLEIKKLVKQLTAKNINEEELRAKLSDFIRGTRDIIPLYRLVLNEADKQKVPIPSIKKGLAERLVEKAKDEFLMISSNELNEASKLFEELGISKESKRCKEIVGLMFEIVEENQTKLETL